MKRRIRKFIVVDFNGPQPRILKGDAARRMAGKPNTVTNPIIPPRSAPHEWKMGPNGLVSTGSPRPAWLWVIVGAVLGATLAALLLKI